MSRCRFHAGRCAVLLSLVACGDAPPDKLEAPVVAPGAHEVAFEFPPRGEGAVLVPVTVNGQGPFRFVLDTGATLTCVEPALARQLGIESSRAASAAGAAGVAPLQLVRLDRVAVGGAAIDSLQGCVLDLAHLRAAGLPADGLLGLNYLRSFNLTLDFERRVLRLEARAGRNRADAPEPAAND